ncbi:type IV pili methyl-accepting chemotaxis transducer N-terminal domain-containing protein [Yoonia maricola]|nr:type IV pili methyl-accepting chemotaxis transducer N-terminal domain-containing protein [Yoonia maricola]
MTQVHAQETQAAAADAATTNGDAGGGARINLSGKLRMLSQRIVASACYLQAGVSSDDSGAMLVAAQEEFALITDALQNGNDDLGVFGEETRRKTLIGIELLRDLWVPVSAGADEIAAGNGSQETVQQIATDSAPLLEMAQKLVPEISQQYSNPGELLLRDTLVIDIAGRQRMLAQRVSKNVCLFSVGLGSDAVLAELQSAADMFDASLRALRNGMPDAGVQGPPTPEIAAGLDGVITDWGVAEPLIATVLSGEQINADDLATMFSTANRLTGGMNTAVGLYAEASKLGG